ncbi:MAG: hemerythrin domain-containing protein [Acidimicrobiales bacterium]
MQTTVLPIAEIATKPDTKPATKPATKHTETNTITGPETGFIIDQVLSRALRTDAARLVEALARARPRRPGEGHPALPTWFGRFRNAIAQHHAAQDRTFFPALMARTDAIDALLGRLERDHDRIEDLTEQLQQVLPAMEAATARWRWDILHQRACRLSGELLRVMVDHLDLEDEVVRPELARNFSAAEYEQLAQRANQHTALSQLAFSIPWVMAHSTDGERDALLRDAPMSFALLWRATRRHYERVARSALHPDAPRRAYPGEWADGASPMFN